MNAFIIGTDTNVGKTLICASIVGHLLQHSSTPVTYIKPLQSGCLQGDDDAQLVKHLATPLQQAPQQLNVYTLHQFGPARAPGQLPNTLTLDALQQSIKPLLQPNTHTIVEAAGGLLVPITAQSLQVELIKALGLPTILVCSNRLGALNHVLLTQQVLQHYQIPLAGVIANYSHTDSESYQVDELNHLLEQWLPMGTPLAWAGYNPQPQHSLSHIHGLQGLQTHCEHQILQAPLYA